MFNDHLFFHRLAMRSQGRSSTFACARSRRVNFPNTTLSLPMPVCPESRYEVAFMLHHCSARTQPGFIPDMLAAEASRDLYSLGRQTPATGKEGTSC